MGNSASAQRPLANGAVGPEVQRPPAVPIEYVPLRPTRVLCTTAPRRVTLPVPVSLTTVGEGTGGTAQAPAVREGSSFDTLLTIEQDAVDNNDVAPPERAHGARFRREEPADFLPYRNQLRTTTTTHDEGTSTRPRVVLLVNQSDLSDSVAMHSTRPHRVQVARARRRSVTFMSPPPSPPRQLPLQLPVYYTASLGQQRPEEGAGRGSYVDNPVVVRGRRLQWFEKLSVTMIYRAPPSANAMTQLEATTNDETPIGECDEQHEQQQQHLNEDNTPLNANGEDCRCGGAIRGETVEPTDSNEEMCIVCLCGYEDGDNLRVLPCWHRFHATCVDSWFYSGRSKCPICRHDLHKGAHETALLERNDVAVTD